MLAVLLIFSIEGGKRDHRKAVEVRGPEEHVFSCLNSLDGKVKYLLFTPISVLATLA